MFDVKPDKYEGKLFDWQLIGRNDICKGINACYQVA